MVGVTAMIVRKFFDVAAKVGRQVRRHRTT
jgi:hypothetical protein